jgi:phenylalanine-4-hydroxylase
LRESPAHAAGDVLDGDRVFTRGDRVGWATNADT